MLRKKKNLNQHDAAVQFGISMSSYCRYEQGVREPPLSLLWEMADYFEVSVDYLIGRTDTP